MMSLVALIFHFISVQTSNVAGSNRTRLGFSQVGRTRFNVLWFDDELENYYLWVAHLSLNGYVLRCVTDTADLADLKNGPFDIILMELQSWISYRYRTVRSALSSLHI